jgi:MoaA/NifB/PqqE/SkfB family radical SAM enzyme
VKALIKVGYTCNNNCCFCHSTDHRADPDLSTAELLRKIDLCAESGHDMVVLSGGEPTIRPDLLEAASHTARRGLDFGLVTNGRMLSYGSLLDRLFDRRLRYVHVSLHGDRRVHDAMVVVISHGESLSGARQAAALGLRPTINCVVTRHNIDHLRALVDLLTGDDSLTLKFSMVEAKGRALERFDEIVPTVTEAAAAIVDAMAYARDRGVSTRHDGVPLCLLPGLEHLLDDLVANGFRSMSEACEKELFPIDEANKTKPLDTCEGCAHRVRCPGLYVAYHARRGAREIARTG